MAHRPRGAANNFYDTKSDASTTNLVNVNHDTPSDTSRSIPYRTYESTPYMYMRNREEQSQGIFNDAAREAFQYPDYGYDNEPPPLPVSMPVRSYPSSRHVVPPTRDGQFGVTTSFMDPISSDESNRPPLSIVTDPSFVRQGTDFGSSLSRNIPNTPKTNSSGSTIFWPDSPSIPPASSTIESVPPAEPSFTPKPIHRHNESFDASTRHNNFYSSVGSNDGFDGMSTRIGRSAPYRNGSLQTQTPDNPFALGIASSLSRDASFASDSSLSTTVSSEFGYESSQVSRGPEEPSSRQSGSVPSLPVGSSNVNLDTDQYAIQFLRERLGERKFSIFVSRLYERRLNGEKIHLAKARAKSRKQDVTTEEVTTATEVSATTIDFLAKVEVVKEVLRLFVPRPHEAAKQLSHRYPPSPTGEVTLTRAMVLGLCGWSNTQFAYWGRRVEALSVLSQYDDRLKALADALERKHYSEEAGQLDEQSQGSQSQTSIGDELVTGKGLDAIIDEVKQRTQASPFIRGKHSGLDAFGMSSAVRAARSVHYDAEIEVPPSQPTSASTSVIHVKRSPSPTSEMDRARTSPTFSPIYRLGNYRHSPPPTSSHSAGPGPNSSTNQGQAVFNVYDYPPRRFISRSSSGSSSGNQDDSTPTETTRMTFRVSDSRGSPHPKAAAASSDSPSEKGKSGPKRKTSSTELDSRKRRKKSDE